MVKTVPKKWGKEEWLVNEPEYCAKYLHINKGASGSMHLHPVKKETFIVVKGRILLYCYGLWSYITPENMPITIEPGMEHQFTGRTEENIILEISTHHDDNDVVRLNENKLGQEMSGVT